MNLIQVPFFISSSDNTYDVFNLTAPKFLEAARDLHSPIYVGLNLKISLPPFNSVSAPVSDWGSELLFQISQLSDDVNFLILVLDDFYFHDKIDKNTLQSFIDIVHLENIDYLRLVPLQRSLFVSAINNFLNLFFKKVVRKIKNNEPYYSSLQVSIWRKEHLISLLKTNVGIWDFEHLVLAGSKHYAVANSFLNYEHLVEKGYWLRNAPSVLNNFDLRHFLPRGFDSRLIYRYKIVRQAKFYIFGYSIYKLKKCLNFSK